MVDVVPINIYMPTNPEEFTTNPYDVMSDEEIETLRKRTRNMVHIILPEGNDFKKARETLERYVQEGALEQKEPSLYLYSQSRHDFKQRGVIGGFSLEDYGNNKIKRHEKTREKPLKNRIAHIKATKAGCGLVWMMMKSNRRLKLIFDGIEQTEPIFNFQRYGWQNKLWRIPEKYTQEIQAIIKQNELYIADGHHRIAAAYEYMKEMRANRGDGPWNYVLGYVANDDELRILPYNRVIKKLPIGFESFLSMVEREFDIVKGDSTPKKHEICMFNGEWYKLIPKEIPDDPVNSLDVAILQNRILSPILGITDPRKDPNIFFVGGEMSKEDMEGYVTKKGNALFFSLYPTTVHDVEMVADAGLDMPPKSTWFDPKLLSGLAIYPLE
ncbi:MAG: DUF1015 domain-containing protein [Candidatus Diapherotrites archaeon]|nr:DUF1015 domain-containing protein [Candidatus Diapherotrites archaeon]